MLHAQVEGLPLNSIMNYLGLPFDGRMMLAANPGSLEKKMTGIVLFLKNTPHFVEDAPELVVQPLMLSGLKYCSAVWWTLDNTPIFKLLKTMNFAARTILVVRKDDAVTPFMKEVNWLTVDLLSSATACFMYKVANHLFSGTLVLMFLIVHEVSERTTRQSNNLHVSMALTTPEGSFWLIGGPGCGTACLPDTMKECRSLPRIKRKLHTVLSRSSDIGALFFYCRRLSGCRQIVTTSYFVTFQHFIRLSNMQ